jgi:hypothetical protein
MIIGINPEKAPLRKYASVHLRAIKHRELADNLESRGVKIVHVGDSAIKVSLRGLLAAAGTIQRAQLEIMNILRELGADSVNIEPEDIEYLSGRDVFSHTIARGLEAGVPQLEAILQDIPISEDNDGDDVVPIFGQLDKAAHFVATDFHPDEDVHDKLKRGAERDLFTQGLLQGNDDYRDWMEVKHEEPAPLPEQFQTQARPYKSIFDKGGF